MSYLVDANVLSEPTRRTPNSAVVDWLRSNERQVSVDPIILGEVSFGILLLPRGRRRTQLKRWFDSGVKRLRCLTWDAETGLFWAELLASMRSRGISMPVKDSMIAASALRHELILVTRNERDFAKAGVPLLDPFQG